jgi:hypothetical protein
MFRRSLFVLLYFFFSPLCCRKFLRHVEHIRSHFWNRYSVAVNQVIVATVNSRSEDFSFTKRNPWFSSFLVSSNPSEGRLRTKPYNKRDDFNFPIVNFPFICSNIPAALAYGVYIFQMIRYSRACEVWSRPICIWGILFFNLNRIDAINKITKPRII